MNTIEFQVVEGLNLTTKRCSENALIKGLKGKKMQLAISPIRSKVNTGDIEGANDLKKQLPAILVSGIFNKARKYDCLSRYTQIICLDLDKLALEKVQEIKDKAINNAYTYIAFISPSGRGIKIFVKVNSGADQHKEAYRQVTRYYTELLGVAFDQQTSDITRLTYMSYDPDVYCYPDSDTFQVEQTKVDCAQLPSDSHETRNYQKVYEHAYRFTERKLKYTAGERNRFLYQLACNCNRYGIPKEELVCFLDWCDLPTSEVTSTVSSAYNHASEFNTWTLPIVNALPEEQNVKSSYQTVIGDTLSISQDVKDCLPTLLRRLIQGYDGRQSDMALTAALGLLSGLLSGTRGIYNHSMIYPALSCMVTAPSGSGKSAMGNIQRLFLPVHDQLLKTCSIANGLFLPDNTATPALIKKIADNQGRGILFSTDLGFIGHALKHDTTGLQAIIRAGHSGETINYGRSTKKTAVLVTQPRFAICLSATPPEFQRLFTSTEDGLLSRFIHYCFVPTKDWHNIKSESIACYEANSTEVSAMVMDLHRYATARSFELVLNEEQLLAVNEWLSEETEIAKDKDTWSVISPIIRRIGQVVFKLSMILATLRAWECKSNGGLISTSADDFDIAMKLAKVYYMHAAKIVKYITEKAPQELEDQQQKFYGVLPAGTFKRKDALEATMQAGIQVSTRTIDGWLKKLTETGFLECGYNSYKKIKEIYGGFQRAA